MCGLHDFVDKSGFILLLANSYLAENKTMDFKKETLSACISLYYRIYVKLDLQAY